MKEKSNIRNRVRQRELINDNCNFNSDGDDAESYNGEHNLHLRKQTFFKRPSQQEPLFRIGSLRLLMMKLRRLKSFVFLPTDRTIIALDYISFALIIIDLIVLPITLAFNDTSVTKTFGLVTAIFFLVEMLANFNTADETFGTVIKNRKKMAIAYFKGLFIWDFLATIVAPLLAVYLPIFAILRLGRIFRLKKILQNIEDSIELSDLIATMIGFLKLSVMLLAIAHYFGCSWYSLGRYEYKSGLRSWLTPYIDDSLLDCYTVSLYWAVTTMITVGYGDIHPITNLERYFAVGTMIVGCGQFGYSMNAIGSLFDQLGRRTALYKSRIIWVNNALKNRPIGDDLKQKIRGYFRYLWDTNHLEIEGESLLDLLSDSLRKRVQVETYLKVIQGIDIFDKLFSKGIIEKLMLLIREGTHVPDDSVLSNGDQPQFCIVGSGNLKLWQEETDTVLSLLHKGQIFAQDSFFTGSAIRESVRSVTFSSVYRLELDELLPLFDLFPSDREKFKCLSDKVKFYGDYSLIGMKCICCGDERHLYTDCGTVRYVVDRTTFTGFLVCLNRLHRAEFRRQKRRTKHNTLYNQKKLEKYLRSNVIPSLAELTIVEEKKKDDSGRRDRRRERGGHSLPPLSDLTPNRMHRIEDWSQRLESLASQCDDRMKGVERKVAIIEELTSQFHSVIEEQPQTQIEATNSIVNERQVSFLIDRVWVYANYFPNGNVDAIRSGESSRGKSLDSFALLRNILEQQSDQQAVYSNLQKRFALEKAEIVEILTERDEMSYTEQFKPVWDYTRLRSGKKRGMNRSNLDLGAGRQEFTSRMMGSGIGTLFMHSDFDRFFERKGKRNTVTPKQPPLAIDLL